MSLFELSTSLNEIRGELSTLRARESQLKEMEGALIKDITDMMREVGLNSAESAGLKFRIKTDVVARPDPEHWQDIFNWIATNDQWHLVRRQLNSTGVKEMATAGIEIPFVEVVELEKLAVTG
jgi:hypothetical protein